MTYHQICNNSNLSGELEVTNQEGGQTIQWPKDTKGVIRSHKSRRRTDNTMATRYQRGN
jgi:hypothetical protein